MKRILLLTLAVPLVFVGTVFATTQPNEDKKVTICHATSSVSNPWLRIVVSENAISGHFNNPGTPKAGHEQDLLIEGENGICPAPKIVDLCKNLEGNQAIVPDGFVEKDGLCIPQEEKNPDVSPKPIPTPTTTPVTTTTPSPSPSSASVVQVDNEIKTESYGGK